MAEELARESVESVRESYLKEAISAYREALEFYGSRAPSKTAGINNNLGNAYWGLSEVRHKEENLALAISAYREALKIYTQKDFPDLYHKAKANLEKVLALEERS